jgi:hypothetical protein
MTITDDDMAGVLATEYRRFVRRFREWGWDDTAIRHAILGAAQDALATHPERDWATVWRVTRMALERAFTEEGAYS